MATYKAEAIVMPNGDEFVPDENVFVAEYGVTTWAEVNAAYQAGKAMYCRRDMGGWIQQLAFSHFDDEGNGFNFSNVNGDGSIISWVNIYEVESWNNYTQKTHAYPNQSVSPSSSQYISVSTTSGTLNRSTINFGSSTTKYLSQTGTWENVPTVPSNVSSFNNDAGYVNSAGAAAAAPVQSVNGQTGTVTLTIPTVPTDVSSFNNDAGYLTLSTLPIWDGSIT